MDAEAIAKMKSEMCTGEQKSGYFTLKAVSQVSFVKEWKQILGEDANTLQTGLCAKFHLPMDEKGKFHWEDLDTASKYNPEAFLNTYAPNATAREKVQLCTMRANAACGSYKNLLACLEGKYGTKAQMAVKMGTGYKSFEHRSKQLWDIAEAFTKAVKVTYGPMAELEARLGDKALF